MNIKKLKLKSNLHEIYVMETSKNPEKFKIIKERITMKNRMITELNKMIRNIKTDIDLDKNELYSLCNHKYERECTTTGCYAEYDWICVYCRKYR